MVNYVNRQSNIKVQKSEFDTKIVSWPTGWLTIPFRIAQVDTRSDRMFYYLFDKIMDLHFVIVSVSTMAQFMQYIP